MDTERPRCKAQTKKGRACSRRAQVGSEYCWQHRLRRTSWPIPPSLQKRGITKRNLLGVMGVLLGIIGLLADVTGLADYFFGSPVQRMTGDFRIAVAGFVVEAGDTSLGEELAEGVRLNFANTIDELELDFTVTVWGPTQVGSIRGDTELERARSAEELAQRYAADMVVYGLIDMSDSIWSVTPEFYLTDRTAADTDEVTGQHQLGETFYVTGRGSTATRAEISRQLTSRSELLTRMAVGLANYTAHNYVEALNHFEAIEDDDLWEEIGGKEVLFILIGNAAGRANNLETAQQAYEQALLIDSEYARALAGLASVYYLQALEPFEESGNPADTSIEMLQRSIDTYLLARQAERQPELADIPVKIDFGLGQNYFMLVYANGEGSFAEAVEHFQAVINAYGAGENPRIKHLAAEAHARLGLIYIESGRSDLAIEEYKIAAGISDDPERRTIFEKRVQELTD